MVDPGRGGGARDGVDVVVVGAGLVGASLALDLARRGFSVAVVEARPPAEPPRLSGADAGAAFDLRVSAVSLGAQRYLERLGAWSRVPASRIGVFRRMHVWDAASRGEIDFTAADLDAPATPAPALGYIVENRWLEHALEAELAGEGVVSWRRPAQVTALGLEDARIRVELANGSDGTLTAGLVVGADGTDSTVRALAGIDARVNAYPQRAVVATVRAEHGHQDTAWQRFLAEGPLALLPLPGRAGSIVWSTRPDEAERLLALAPADFARELERAFGSRLGPFACTGARGSFALRRARVERYVAERVALVGDAAHTIHPLAGQGVNLGFLDAATLAHVLGAAAAGGRDPGARAALRRYERWRRAHNAFVEAAMDGLHWLFLRSDPAWRGARGAGLSATDRIGPLKRQIMRLAMGVGGDLPPGFGAAAEPPPAPDPPPGPGPGPATSQRGAALRDAGG